MIKMLVMDVDGTLTDGKIYIDSRGNEIKAFNIKDGYAIARLRNHGIEPVIITGRKSVSVSKRANELGISEVHQGIADKIDLLKKLISKYAITNKEVAYIGDDLNDIECMSLCGLNGCPADAANGVKNKVDFVSTKDGGNGAVRDFIEYILGVMQDA